MAPSGRRSIVPRRRRVEDGEEEGSVLGDVDDDSLSEPSVASDGEAEASDGSLDEERELAVDNQKKNDVVKNSSGPEAQPGDVDENASAALAPSVDAITMMNGLSIQDNTNVKEELNFDDVQAEEAAAQNDEAQTPHDAPKAAANETMAQKSRREHQEYIRQRDADPAFVPNRGGFFLHDDRTSTSQPFVNQVPGRGRGRGRGYNTNAVYGPRGAPPSEPSDFQWAHDLHDRHENVKVPSSQIDSGTTQPDTRSTAVTKTAPNRTFSFTTVLGNVAVNVALPGMREKRVVSSVTKKNHTLLPQHRPPLRRDKPVRISLPDDHPRYIFPSTERSFIFIPRALRPNQQPYMRGRGHGSFQGSRRTSVYAGSVYTPSVAMSRKSSFGGVRDNLRSPMGSNSPRPNMSGMEGMRPVVRMPASNTFGGPAAMNNLMPLNSMNAGMAPMNGAFVNGHHAGPLPLYQPRPQKTVSVAGIEPATLLGVKGPPQQQEQPFHQQMPIYMGDNGGSSGPQGTPLSHIPEGAIYAQPFQPVPFMQPPMYYPTPYANGPAFFPPALPDGMQSTAGFGGMPMPMPGAYPAGGQTQGHAPPGGSMPGMAQPNTMAHVSNGMVFYYDPTQSQSSNDGQGGGPPFTLSAQVPMNPQAQYYYPVAPFYPAQSA